MNNEPLIGTLVELADNLVDDFDVVDLLSLLSERCVEHLDIAAAGVMLAAPGSPLQVVASSSEGMRILELFELQANEGPCMDSFRTGVAVHDLDLSIPTGRWPRFGPKALADGFRSVSALPLRLRSRTIGALNLFRTEAGALDAEALTAAQALADIATIAIVQHQAAIDAQVLNKQLTEAINSRVLIEQAKGRISEAASLDMDSAFDLLRRHARRNRLHLTDVSRDVASGAIDAASLDPHRPAPATTERES